MERFPADVRWFRGCTHMHTTESDGEKTPVEAAEAYRDAGYDFAFITDHDRITDPKPLNGNGILLIPGAEYYWRPADGSADYHLVALGPEREPSILPNKASGPQQAIDMIRDTGAMAILAHPYWCGLEHDQMVGLDGLTGVEVYNHVCEVEVLRGDSRAHWDGLLLAGKRLHGLAADDTHWRTRRDAPGSWICVAADQLTQEVILRAIRAGAFYASNGPSIQGIRVEDGTITVACSPAAKINFMGRRASGQTYYAEDHLLTGISHPIHGKERYLRVEVVAEDGSMAWSNPVYIENRGLGTED